MQRANADTLQPQPEANARTQPQWFAALARQHSTAWLFLAITLPISILLCFLIAPMESPDESRHFLRACQIAQGQILPQIDPATHRAGGLLPAPAVDFVRDKMNPEFFRQEDRLHTIGERLHALDQASRNQAPISKKEFAAFPGSAVYPPALYLPQSAGIFLARLFTNKVYVWFYSARVLNAIVALLLVFWALRLAPAYQLVLLIPAILPMSLYQISSASSDAGIITISILFVALSIRFLTADGALLRAGLLICLLLLTLAKPVDLPFGILLLAAYKRLGWRRATLFCSGAIIFSAAAYLAWSYFVRPIFPLAARDFPDRNPHAQVHFMLAHPVAVVLALLHTLKWDARNVVPEMIGIFGWAVLPLPVWFYKATYCFFAAILLLMLVNWTRIGISKFLLGGLAAASVLLAILLAGFVLWSPVGSQHVLRLQGRYFIPILAVLPFLFPPLDRLGKRSKLALACLVSGYLALSLFTTVRIVKHYYFPESPLLGANIHALFTKASGQSCPASITGSITAGWFSTVARGRATVPGSFRVLITTGDGTILAVSDPVLAGADFPFDLLPGSSHSKWLLNLWTLNRNATTLQYWLLTGEKTCTFGDLKLLPYQIPEA